MLRHFNCIIYFFRRFFIIFIHSTYLIRSSLQNMKGNLVIKKLENKQIEVKREFTENSNFTKKRIKIVLIKIGQTTNTYTTEEYNYIEFDLPKYTELTINFDNEDCIFPILTSANPNIHTYSITFNNNLATLYYDDIGNMELLNLEKGKVKRYDEIQNNINAYKDDFKSQLLFEYFNSLYRGMIYCLAFQSEDSKKNFF